MADYRIGIDVGGTKTAFGVFKREELVDGSCLSSDRTLTSQAFFDVILEETHRLIRANNIDPEDLMGVGVGMPSFVDFNRGHIVLTSNLPKIRDFAARDYLQQRLNCRVVFDNDSHTAAIAEHRYGAGRGFDHMIYCAVSTGIANGIIINNALFRGSYGWAGESGHMLITPDEGVECGCGNTGCFMSNCSGSMIVRHVQKRLAVGEKSILPEIAGGEGKITARDIQQAAREGDALALWAVDAMGRYLGMWLFNLYEMLNINCFVMGGGLVKFGPMLFDKVRQVFDRYNRNDYPVYFKFAELEDNFGIIGAAALLLDED